MSQRGLTLVEALFTLGIAVVVGTMLLVIIVNSAGLFYGQSGKLQQGLNLNEALSAIREAIRGSSSVASSYPEIGSPTYTSGATQLVLKVPSINSQGEVISSTYDYYIFYKDANKLRFKTFPAIQSTRKAQDQIFSTSLHNLTFEYFDAQTPPQQVQPNLAVKIKITAVLRQKAGAGFETNTATAEANLRND